MKQKLFKTTCEAISSENTVERRVKFFHIEPVHKSL